MFNMIYIRLDISHAISVANCYIANPRKAYRRVLKSGFSYMFEGYNEYRFNI